MQQLLAVFKDVLETGDKKTDRTGTGTISKFGGMMKFCMQDGKWPIATTRKVAHGKIAEELEWMIKGLINVQWLNDRDNNIWNSWMGKEAGTIGPMYGEQWRNWNATGGLTKEVLSSFIEKAAEDVGPGAWEFPDGRQQFSESFFKQIEEFTKPYEQGGRGGTDQLQYIVDELLNNPHSRRMVANVWHAGLLPDNKMTPSENADAGNMALAPCHAMWQVNTAPLTDIEILTQISYRSEWGIGMSEDHRTVWPKIQAPEDVIPALLDVKMVVAVPIPKGGVVYAPSEAGTKLINKWKAEGRPVHKLSLLCFARSQDLPLGTVFNVGMYSLLAHQLAALTNMVAWEYTHLMGDYHIYQNQVPMVMEQMTREPMGTPRVIVDPTLRSIDDFNAKGIQVFYKSHPAIKFPMAAV